jgi:hypothetical protein
MTKDQLARILVVREWHRMACPSCGGDETLIAREWSFYPVPLPLEAGDLRLDVQMRCRACEELIRLRVYELIDELQIRLAPDDPQSDAAALNVTDL